MKMLLIFLLFQGLLYCQDPHMYFPHHVGDLWQYVDDSGVYSSVKFLRDSIDKSGNIFIHIRDTEFPQEYWEWKFSPKGDSGWQMPFVSSWNYLLYKFPLEVGETWRIAPDWIIARVEGSYELNLWGIERTVYRLAYYPDTTFIHWYWVEEYAIGIGQIWYGNEVMYRNLIGCVIDGDTLGTIVGVEDDDHPQPRSLSLYQNYPNPFNPVTRIDYEIKEYGFVDLRIYNTLGEEITLLVSEEKSPGRYTINFNAAGLPSGVYFYRLKSGENVIVKNMLLLK